MRLCGRANVLATKKKRKRRSEMDNGRRWSPAAATKHRDSARLLFFLRGNLGLTVTSGNFLLKQLFVFSKKKKKEIT